MRWKAALAGAALTLLAATVAAQTRPLGGVVLSNDAWPRTTRLSEWTADVMRISGLEHASETAQGKAFFEWLRLFSRMAVGGMIQAYEGEYGKEKYVLDAHKQLFVYGWGYCDTTSRIAEAAWQEYKHDPHAAMRVCVQHDNGGYHTMYRLRMDGRYGAFDPRYGYYLVERDGVDARILDWAELNGKFEMNRGYNYRSRPFFEIEGVEWQRALLLHPAYFESENAWRAAGAPKEHVFGDSVYQMGTRFHDMGFSLKRGMKVERFWDNQGRHFYVPAGAHAQRELPFLPSGRFYRVTETSHHGNWPKFDPNHDRVKAYLSTVPRGEGYPADLEGGRTIGQAYGVIEYKPDLRNASGLDGVLPGATLIQSDHAPYLRPASTDGGGEAVFDIRSPFVLVDGTLTATLAGNAEIAIRTLAPKPRDTSEPDAWSDWQTLPANHGQVNIELGRPRFNGRDRSIHGLYRFQIRVRVPQQARRETAAGLSAFALKLYFENGIMSITPLFAGKNTLRLRVADAASLAGPIVITYRYVTAAGEKELSRTLQRTDFQNDEAVATADAPGLERCKSVAIVY